MEKTVQRAKQLINDQLEKPIGLPAIADRLRISYHTLRKQFLRTEGISMLAYTQAERMAIAKRLLKKPDLAVFQITYMTGFSATSNFTRWFKSSTGSTPTEYRKKYLDCTEL